jgi:hypothetical protein
MPASKAAFTIRSNSGINKVLKTDITIRPSGMQSHLGVKAIWDTGATSSAITTKVVNQLGLIPTGRAIVSTANGIITQNTYTIDIKLPTTVLIKGIVANEISALTSGCDALIGMDIITLGDFSITNHKGITCMSFRVPSCHEIDYVKNLNYGITPIHNILPGKQGSKFTPPKKKRRK